MPSGPALAVPGLRASRVEQRQCGGQFGIVANIQAICQGDRGLDRVVCLLDAVVDDARLVVPEPGEDVERLAGRRKRVTGGGACVRRSVVSSVCVVLPTGEDPV